jgi:peptide chain release factor 1
MLEKLRDIEVRYDRLSEELGDPALTRDPHRFQQVARAHAELMEVVAKYREYQQVERQLEETKTLVDETDGELRDLAEEELRALSGRRDAMERELVRMLLPKDPNDEKDTIIEIRAGTGGDEASLFAGDLLRMYTRYAERMGWKVEMLSANPGGAGGFKEVVIAIKGRGAYSHLKFEAGPHRVQRVPETESSGRIHTSAATVVVMPEVEEVEVVIHPDELEIDTYRSASAGGQNVQKNETAIRILHKPTGLVVTCQDERSQLQNREKAMRMLRARLYERKQAEQNQELSSLRKSQIASGDRSDKIRTYNFPQGRVTDHRIGLTLYRLDTFLDGDIQEMVEALRTADEADRLARGEEETGGRPTSAKAELSAGRA